jgi:predicted methyltransferase
VIDHAGKPDADNAKLHRIHEDLVVKAVTDAGFVVEAKSDVLRNPDDNHTLPVFNPDIRGKTDRFVLRLRKPEEEQQEHKEKAA